VLAGIKFTQIKQLIGFGEAMAKAGPPPEFVGTHAAAEATWERTRSSVGTVTPDKGVTIANEVPGVVSAIRFDSGAVVKRGQVLVELDSSVERAQLASVVARRNLAKVSAERSRALVDKEVAPQSQLDADESQLKGASADAAALQAQIEKKIVRAPFDGKLGIRQVNVGQYLEPGTAITVLQSTDAVYVDFTLPQTELERVAVGTAVRIEVAGEKQPIAGKIAAIDPTLDAVTRAVKLRASVDTGHELLKPGMFVNVVVVLPERMQVVIVPQTAVIHASFGNSLFIVEEKKDDKGNPVKGPDGKPALVARQQFVKTGDARGDFIAIVEGVKAGQQVVSAGAFKLRNGAGVVINNQANPTPQLEPRPENR
jgi:membrane fusion protein (multidrug efflux system)